MQIKIIQEFLFHLISYFHLRAKTEERFWELFWQRKAYTCTSEQRINASLGRTLVFQSSTHICFSHCMQGPLFQAMPSILSHCHAPVWQPEPQYPVPKSVPALTSTKHCILFNHFGDISIWVNTEVTGALDRCKTKEKRNIKEQQYQRAVEPG